MTHFRIPRHQLRDAGRLGVQSALAGSLTFLAMQYFEMPDKFVGILSAVLVVQPSIGQSLGTASERVVATLIGALTATLVWPDRSESRAARYLRLALRAIAARLSAAAAPATGAAGDGADSGAAHSFHSSIADARRAAGNVRLDNADRLREELELVERLYNSVVMVGRAARSGGGPLLQSDPGLQAIVDELRRDTSRAVSRLADRKSVTAGQLASLRDRLVAARDRIPAADQPHGSVSRRHAFIFAFEEILEFLEALTRLRATRQDWFAAAGHVPGDIFPHVAIRTRAARDPCAPRSSRRCCGMAIARFHRDDFITRHRCRTSFRSIWRNWSRWWSPFP